MTTVLLPYFSEKEEVSWDVAIETIQRFLFVLVLLIPFEIRDLAYDDVKLKTLPQRYGVTNTKLIGAFLSLVFFLATFLKDQIGVNELLVKGILFLGLCGLMYVTKRNQTKYYASFWVEAVSIIWLVVLLILEKGINLV